MEDSVSCVIPGARREAQVEINSSASDLQPLARIQMKEVKRIYNKYIKEHVHYLW